MKKKIEITAEEFRLLSARIGFNQTEFGLLLGVTQKTISIYEKIAETRPDEIIPLKSYQVEIFNSLRVKLKHSSESHLLFGQKLKKTLKTQGFITSILLILGIDPPSTIQ